MAAIRDENTVVRGMVLAVIITLGAIGILASVSFYVLTTQIEQQKKYSDMLSLCAQQRVLTQRAALLGFSLVSAHDENLQKRLRGELVELASNMEQTNAALAGEKTGEIPSPAIRASFSGPPLHLNSNVRRFTEEVKALAAEPSVALTIDNAHLYYVATASTDLMRKLELLTEQYRHEGQYGVLQLQRDHELILGLTLLVLLGAALFIFKPMIQRLRIQLHEREIVARELELSSAALKERSEQLARSNKELEQFASIVAHDLRAPLQNIILGIEMLMSKMGESSETSTVMTATRSAAERMTNLISGLLKYSRAAADVSPLSPVSLSEVIDEILEDLSATIAKAKATVSRSELPTVRADRVQMHQLFQNLLENALKYRHPDRAPAITIKSVSFNMNGVRHHQISVQDNGIGFDASQAEYMFRMFTRLQSSNDSRGMGIGLATCERIVRRHEGTIRAEGKPGQGSTFIITLPDR